MKKILLLISLVLISSCGNNIKEFDKDGLESLIESKASFVFSLTSKKCSHCNELKKNFNKSKYKNKINYYEIDAEKIIDGISEDPETYIYFANLLETSFKEVKSYIYQDTYFNYFKTNYQIETFLEYDYYLEGYVDLVYPLSFFYVDGLINGFEYGNYTSKEGNIDIVMEAYLSEVN